jgi:hypothetical protein
MAFAFEIEPRSAALGGGWRMRLLEDEKEMGGGVFPIEENVSSDDAYADALQEGQDWLCAQRGTAVEGESDAREG